MVHPVLCAYTAKTGNKFTGEYIIWMELPLTAFTMFLSMIMQPKRNSRAYLCFITCHYFSYTLLAEVLRTVFDQSSQQVVISIGRSVLWIAVAYAIMVGRKRISEKSQEDLSYFLTHRVLKEGILAGLAQILFIMFDAVRCDFENGWENCTRTLASGGGLSALVVIFVGARIVSGIPPPSIMKEHVIPAHRLITMDLSLKEQVLTGTLGVSGICGLFLLGNYGAEGEFSSHGELIMTMVIVNLGFACASAVFFYKFYLINRQLVSAAASPSPSPPPPPPAAAVNITKGSPYLFWMTAACVFALQVQHLMLCFTLDAELMTTTSILVPLTWMFVAMTIFSDPRRRDKRYINMLRALFLCFALISELLFCVYSARQYWLAVGRWYWVFFFLGRFTVECLLFHELLKMRAKIGRLQDEAVSNFLTKSVYGGGLKAIGCILFVDFRAVNCMIEKGMAECKNTATAGAGFISVNIIVVWMLYLVMVSVPLNVRDEICLTYEKICELRLSPLRRLEALCFVICGICTLVLFSLVNSKKGSNSAFFVNVGCHYVYHFGSFCLTFFFNALYVCYALTGKDYFWETATIIQPLCILSFMVAFLMQPKRNDRFYHCLLVGHFLQFAVLTEITAAVGSWRAGWRISAVLGVLRVFFVYVPVLKFAWFVRGVISEASLPKLNKYLTITLMRNGSATAMTMVFFAVETFGCKVEVVSGDSGADEDGGIYETGSCVNSAYVGMFLSLFVLIFFIHDLSLLAMPQTIQASFAIPLAQIANFRLKKRHRFQFFLMTATFISAFYLFSFVGVPDSEDPEEQKEQLDRFLFIGGMGSVAMLANLFVDLATLHNKFDTYKRRVKEGRLRISDREDSIKDIDVLDLNDVEENMTTISGGLL
ncbi:hypothetical protein TrRE_jg5984 [Triparma retinervis]|uniref:Uncharacterized protein n=1 Tax=Triparma retinervis TaxID=2557542 RepID=A0A9W7CBP2_9STRA|nr:hypothetical protein TrRE_jg5984 [Triparma retinervis]